MEETAWQDLGRWLDQMIRGCGNLYPWPREDLCALPQSKKNVPGQGRAVTVAPPLWLRGWRQVIMATPRACTSQHWPSTCTEQAKQNFWGLRWQCGHSSVLSALCQHGPRLPSALTRSTATSDSLERISPLSLLKQSLNPHCAIWQPTAMCDSRPPA